MIRKTSLLASAVLGLCVATATAPVLGEDNPSDGIAKYREMLQEGNPADLVDLKGEELWKTKRGPNNVSLEKCDFGLGPGVVEGAYAQLPRYFKDTGKVMDAESRLVYCMVTLQGYSQDEITKNWYSRPGNDSDIEALVTFIGARSNGKSINVPNKHPAEAAMYKEGEYIFYRRSGPQDFSCAVCHSNNGKRIRLQELGNLTTKEGAGIAMQGFPAYRVSQGSVWTMQHRLIDCMRQARWPEPSYLSDAVVALEVYLQGKASGTVMQTPGIKR